MTETPPEQPLPDPIDDDELDPARDADGVTEDRLTGVMYYDTLEFRYVGGVHKTKAAARKAEDYTGDRYVLRRV